MTSSIRYPKRQTILVGSLSLQTNLAIVPYNSQYLNNRLEKLNPREDDILLIFQDAWRKTQVLLVSKCRINLNTAVGSFIIRYAFPNKTLATLTTEWTAVCLNEGYGKTAYSLDNVLLLHTREFIKEIWEAEERRKQEIADAIARQAERQRLPGNAKRGIYQHPDIMD